MQNVSHSCQGLIGFVCVFSPYGWSDTVSVMRVSMLADTDPMLILRFGPPVPSVPGLCVNLYLQLKKCGYRCAASQRADLQTAHTDTSPP